MSLTKNNYLLYYFLLSGTFLFAQKDSIPTQSIDLQANDAIENVILSNQNDNGFQLNTAFERLEFFAKKKINLNKASREDLTELTLLSPIQIEDLLQYRAKLGDLIVLQELQAIPSFDLSSIRRILPYVAVDGDIDDYQISLKNMFLKADNQLFVRSLTFLERSKGYEENKFLGDPFQNYIRFRRTYGTRFSMGITLEKDKGEPYYYKGKVTGADFISGHIAYKTRRYQIYLGDFAANFGQGLVLFQDFAPGKSPFITDIKRQHQVLRTYSSVAETAFLRGGGGTFSLSKNIDVSAFVSYRKRDATINADTAQAFDEVFSSLLSTGFHRTEREITSKGTINNLTTGASIKLKSTNKHLAFNVLYNQFDKALQRNSKPYNQFIFNGKNLLNASVDYSFVKKNYNFFGETAISDNGHLATLNGLLVGLDKTLNFSVLHRFFDKKYQSLLANPIAENTGANNENGFYTGVNILPNIHWKIESYIDIFASPWLRYQVNAPSKGYEYYGRVTYNIKRKLDVYLQYRTRTKQTNDSESTAATTPLTNIIRQQLRLHFQYQLSPVMEWETRVEGSRVEQGSTVSNGFLAYQDLKYKPKNIPISFTARYCLFDTDNYDSRIYTFENNLMYNFSIPPLYGKGTRFYINCRYTQIKNMMIEARIAQTYFANVETIGTGDDAIKGNTKTEVGVQIRYNF